jgi:hypothetical protein
MKNVILSAIVAAVCVVGFTAQAEAKGGAKKAAYQEAKKECLAGDATLKGKALKSCIKEKRAHK